MDEKLTFTYQGDEWRCFRYELDYFFVSWIENSELSGADKMPHIFSFNVQPVILDFRLFRFTLNLQVFHAAYGVTIMDVVRK